MNYVCYDVETTTSNKGSPFDRTNRLVCYGTYTARNNVLSINYPCVPDSPYNLTFSRDEIVVGFNLKFDLNWHRRLGGEYPAFIWDCQLAEFLLSNQKDRYPSLDGAAEKYGLNKKLDIVKLDYWNKGIDTCDIPRDILSDYLTQDLLLTEQIFKIQYRQFTGKTI